MSKTFHVQILKLDVFICPVRFMAPKECKLHGLILNGTDRAYIIKE